MKPSEVEDEPWVWAHRGHGDYPQHTERGGKWLVYVDISYVDDAGRHARGGGDRWVP